MSKDEQGEKSNISSGQIIMNNPIFNFQSTTIRKNKKPVNLEEYRNTKEFINAIESNELYKQLKPKKEDVKKKPKKTGK